MVLVSAAYGEGFGLPIIEGYLFDKPVLASNVCAIPDVIISNDFLFENTVESLISKLYFVKEHNDGKYRNYYDERFSNREVVSKMNQLYKKLL
jgi:glycosyltransferase involved in cell wall biosynthesis